MKNSLRLLAFVCTLLFVSCSSDDNNKVIEAGTWQSNLKVNGIVLKPLYSDDVTTTASYGWPDIYERTFEIKVPATNTQAARGIFIHFSNSGTNASGTYTSEDLISVTYTIGEDRYNFTPGSKLKVEDLGDNNFKLSFINATATSFEGDTIQIEGSIEGAFKYLALEI